jgi:hypothetical protein
MHSHKTLVINDDIKIIFTFLELVVNIDIYNNENFNTSAIYHTEFISEFNKLVDDYNVTNHYAKLIRYWFNKNYNKLHPQTTYTTMRGRTINLK